MKGKKVLLISLLAAIILGFVTTWYLKNLLKPLSAIDLPKFEVPDFNFDFFPSQETKGYTEFIDSDEKLKLKYPSHWMKMAPDTLEKLNQALIDKRTKSLLFVQTFKIEKSAFAFLTVQELSLEEESSLEEIIETIKERVKEQEGEIEIANLKIEGGEAYFEGKYKRVQSPLIYSKEKIILGDNKAYLIIILSLTNDWSEFEKEVNEILSSIQLIG